MKHIRYTTVPILCLLVVMSSNASESINNRTELNFRLGDEIKPVFFLPFIWNQNWYSGVFFEQSNKLTQGELDGFTDSKVSSGVNKQTVQISLINYTDKVSDIEYSIGVSVNDISIDKSEFGYFNYMNGALDEYVAFDNTIGIDVTGLAFHGDAFFEHAVMSSKYRISIEASPSNSLKVDQSTYFKPLVPAGAENKSSITQSIAYTLSLVSTHKINSWFNAGLVLKYDVLPLEYDLQVLASTADRFEKAKIDTVETMTEVGLRIVLSHEIISGLYPVFGISSEKITVEDQVSGQSDSTSDTHYSIGLTGMF